MNLNQINLRNPRLILYAFQLRHSLAMGPGEVKKQEVERFWSNLEKLATPLNVANLQTLKSRLISYEGDKYNPLLEEKLAPNLSLLRYPNDDYKLKDEPPWKVFIEPKLINDTYAVDLTLAFRGNMAVGDLSKLNPTGCLLPSNIHADLGQTLILFAEALVDENFDQYEKLAQECLRNLLPENYQLPTLISSDNKLCGAPIFEYDKIQLDHQLETDQRCHILIWFINDNTIKSAGKVADLMENLLCCRHKIISIYQKSRYGDLQGRNCYNWLEKCLDPEKIQNPESWLPMFPQMRLFYGKYDRLLQDYLTATQINIKNYENLLIRDWAKISPNDQKFWEKFLDKAKNKYQGQIEADLRFLAPGKELFSQLLDTVKSLAEEKRQKQEKALQDEIQAIGVGIATGAFIASCSGLITIPWRLPWDKDKSWYPHPMIGAFLVSMLLAIGAYRLMRWRQKRHLNK